MMRNNRGDLEIKYIVGLVLAIIVLYVIIVFFMGGVGTLGLKFGSLSNKSTEPIETYNLSKIISGMG